MHVAVLMRYPIKSLQGERLAECTFDARGLADDRSWAVYTADGGIGSGKTTRRFRRVDGLLNFRSCFRGELPVIIFPGGEQYRLSYSAADEALSAALGQQLESRREDAVMHHDESPVHVVTTAALRQLGERVAFADESFSEHASDGFYVLAAGAQSA